MCHLLRETISSAGAGVSNERGRWNFVILGTFRQISYPKSFASRRSRPEITFGGAGRHTWADLGKVCRCLLLHVEFKANLFEGSVQFYYLLHCSFHFPTPLDCLFPGKIGNRRTKIPIIRKDFLAIFAVLLKLGSNNNKNLTSKANLAAIQFGRAPKGWLRISWGRYLKFGGL